MENENINMVSQPKDLDMGLFPHQLASIYEMEKLEKEKHIQFDGYFVDTNVGILADLTGYGKTLSIVGLILRDKMEWEMNEAYEFIRIKEVFGDGRIQHKQRNYYQRLNCTLILVNQSLIYQWLQELQHTKLKVGAVSTKRHFQKIDPRNYDVIVCSVTKYNDYVSHYPLYAWKRFIVDEPDINVPPRMRTLMVGFIWLISATPWRVLMVSRKYGFLTEIFPRYMTYDFLNTLVIKNNDDFVKDSFKMPRTIHKYYECYQAMYNVVRGMINDQILEMISAGDIEGAVTILGGNPTSNIIELVRSKKLEEIDLINDHIQFWQRRVVQTESFPNTQRKNKEMVQKWKAKKERAQIQLSTLDKRYSDILKDDCIICFSQKRNPVMIPCCQNIFCGECILLWAKQSGKCPLCRAIIEGDKLIYIKSSEDEEKEKEEKKEEPPKRKTKTDTILEIIQSKPKGRFIIFSCYDTTSYIISNVLQDNIKFAEIRGHRTTRERNISLFKEGKIQVLFLNGRNNGAGINLQEATDMILYHTMTETIETQILGRANRIGRKGELTVHHLLHVH